MCSEEVWFGWKMQAYIPMGAHASAIHSRRQLHLSSCEEQRRVKGAEMNSGDG